MDLRLWGGCRLWETAAATAGPHLEPVEYAQDHQKRQLRLLVLHCQALSLCKNCASMLYTRRADCFKLEALDIQSSSSHLLYPLRNCSLLQLVYPLHIPSIRCTSLSSPSPLSSAHPLYPLNISLLSISSRSYTSPLSSEHLSPLHLVSFLHIPPILCSSPLCTSPLSLLSNSLLSVSFCSPSYTSPLRSAHLYPLQLLPPSPSPLQLLYPLLFISAIISLLA